MSWELRCSSVCNVDTSSMFVEGVMARAEKLAADAS